MSIAGATKIFSISERSVSTVSALATSLMSFSVSTPGGIDLIPHG